MADVERCYQILRGRLYQRLPLLALPLGLLEWREGSAPGTDGAFFYAPEAWLHAAVKTPGDAERYFAALVGVFDGIVQQNGDHLLHGLPFAGQEDAVLDLL